MLRQNKVKAGADTAAQKEQGNSWSIYRCKDRTRYQLEQIQLLRKNKVTAGADTAANP